MSTLFNVNRFKESRMVSDAAIGIPNHILDSLQTRPPTEGATYIIRVKSREEPVVTVFLFEGEESDVASKIKEVSQSIQ